MSFLVKSVEQPFAADGGITVEPRHAEDPYRTLDDLMAVIEALCPVWPQRETFEGAGRMLL